MTAFEYFNPVRLLFAEGALDRLGECMKPTDHHALLVTGTSAARKFGYLDRALAQLSQCGIQATVYDAIPPNPTDAVVDEGAQAAREAGCDVVIGLGGGSAMDSAKAIAVAAPHDLPVRAFLTPDEKGKVRVPTDRTLPVVCVTTTAGTSSEITPFAVVTLNDTRDKTAIRDDRVYPRASICDPELTYNAPPRTTAATGVDVLCHAAEAYLSLNAQPVTDLACQEAIRLVGEFLPRAVDKGMDKEARHQMSLANYFAGMGLSNCGVSMLHALEHPVSGHYPQVAHGEGLAAMLVAYMKASCEFMPERAARVSQLLGGPAEACEAPATCARLLERVGMGHSLAHLGVSEEMLETLASDAARYMAGALSHAPGTPAHEDLMQVLRASLQSV